MLIFMQSIGFENISEEAKKMLTPEEVRNLNE
jgi:hypothetical protein